MIRFEHISGSLAGKAFQTPKASVRIGRDPASDIAWDPRRDSVVSTHHAEVKFNGAAFEIYDLNSSNGLFVNDKKVSGSRKLKDGDVITFGMGGPQTRFLIMPEGAGMATPMKAPARSAPVERTSLGMAHHGAAPMMQPPAPRSGQHASAANSQALAAEAAQRIAQARAAAGGGPSGQTMFIMVDEINKGSTAAVQQSRKKYVWMILLLVVALGIAGAVVWQQKAELDKLKKRKTGIASEIMKLQRQMEMGAANEDQIAQLQALLGQAKAADGELAKKGVKVSAATGDFVTDEIQKILTKFDQDNYAIPPVFRDTVQKHLERISKSSALKTIYGRRQQYWPMIRQEFAKRGIPEEMAYVAWQESQFDPVIESAVGAKGMWQFMAPTARRYGLRVDDRVDERTEPLKLTPAAAKYLGDLLAEFGDLMLAIASYNKGEEGMRKILRQYGFWRKDQRNFWHLYYMKLLPEETMEYVPGIIAAAIICSNPDKYGLPPSN